MPIFQLDALGDLFGGMIEAILTGVIEGIVNAVFGALIPEAVRALFEGAAKIVAAVMLACALGTVLCALAVGTVLLVRAAVKRKKRRVSVREMLAKNPLHKGPAEAEIRALSFAEIRRLSALLAAGGAGSDPPKPPNEPAPQALRDLYGFETWRDVYDVLPAIEEEIKARGAYPPHADERKK